MQNVPEARSPDIPEHSSAKSPSVGVASSRERADRKSLVELNQPTASGCAAAATPSARVAEAGIQRAVLADVVQRIESLKRRAATAEACAHALAEELSTARGELCAKDAQLLQLRGDAHALAAEREACAGELDGAREALAHAQLLQEERERDVTALTDRLSKRVAELQHGLEVESGERVRQATELAAQAAELVAREGALDALRSDHEELLSELQRTRHDAAADDERRAAEARFLQVELCEREGEVQALRAPPRPSSSAPLLRRSSSAMLAQSEDDVNAPPRRTARSSMGRGPPAVLSHLNERLTARLSAVTGAVTQRWHKLAPFGFRARAPAASARAHGELGQDPEGDLSFDWILLEGWCLKRSRWLKAWRRRWAVLLSEDQGHSSFLLTLKEPPRDHGGERGALRLLATETIPIDRLCGISSFPLSQGEQPHWLEPRARLLVIARALVCTPCLAETSPPLRSLQPTTLDLRTGKSLPMLRPQMSSNSRWMACRSRQVEERSGSHIRAGVRTCSWQHPRHPSARSGCTRSPSAGGSTTRHDPHGATAASGEAATPLPVTVALQQCARERAGA
jgi:hypothetical protein